MKLRYTDFLGLFFMFYKMIGPGIGKYLSIWGVKVLFPIGFIIEGGSFILFGTLQWVNDTTFFILFSYVIRFIEVRQYKAFKWEGFKHQTNKKTTKTVNHWTEILLSISLLLNMQHLR